MNGPDQTTSPMATPSPRATPGTAADHRLTVALTFDFDAESPWLGPDGTASPAMMSRGAYGADEGVRRVLSLLDRYQLPATFFVPGDTAERHPAETTAIVAAGHEIGHHGYRHEPPPSLTPDEEREMIERGLEALDRVVGVRPRGYRSPAWELSDSTFGLLEEYGLAYDASQLGADRPHWVQDRGRRTDLVEVPGAWELCDSALFLFSFEPYLRGLAAPSHAEEIWRGDFDGLWTEDTDACYVLTMHPQIIGRPHRMALLERLVVHMLATDGVWFARTGEVADRFRAMDAQR